MSVIFSSYSCAERLAELAAQSRTKAPEYDAVIIGGGIVGSGLARELSIRGKKVILVEKGDFASGTSSKSSKLIHGGLRYLEMFDFGLVFEALAERHWLLKTHPHLVLPLEFNLPLFEKGKAPAGVRSSILLGAGLWLYDALSLFRTPFFHGKHTREEVLKLFPSVRKEGLSGSYYYADAMMLDDELVLETLYDAVKRGAEAFNYVRAVKVGARGGDGKFEVFLEDTLPGLRKMTLQPFAVKAREVIVCAGPWTEKTGSQLSPASGAGRKLKPSKGVHLVLPWQRFPIERCMVMYAPDGRIVFAIPRKDLGKGGELVLLGTTDSPESGDIEDVRSNKDDVEYLLQITNEFFPEAKLQKQDFCMTFAGVRPLIDEGGKSEAKTSREHEIWRNDAGIVFMAGGKYTTFRKISQEIAEFTFPKSGGGCANEESKKPLSTVSEYKERLTGKPIFGKFTDNYIRWKLQHHAPGSFEDVVFRRIPLWMLGRGLEEEKLTEVFNICQEFYKWDKQEAAFQRLQVRNRINRDIECLL